MSDFGLQGLAQVSVSINIPAHKQIVNDAISEIESLQSDLTAAKAENEALRGRVAELESSATEKRIDALNSAFILRKQAEAVDECIEWWKRGDEAVTWFTMSPELVKDYAQSLRQQADELGRKQ